jgi:hypothetical protein
MEKSYMDLGRKTLGPIEQNIMIVQERLSNSTEVEYGYQ